MKKTIIAGSLMVLCAATMFADVDAIGRAKRKPSDIFGGVGVFQQSISGSFNGDTMLTLEGQAGGIKVPKFESGIGKSVMVGVRAYDVRFIGKNDIEVEFSYNFADLPGKWLGQDLDASYQEIGANFRSYFKPGRSVQPFLNMGFNEVIIIVKDGLTNTLESGKAEFTGFGFIIGGGVRVEICKNVGIDVAVVEKFSPIYTVKGAEDEVKGIKGGFKTSNVNINASVKVYF